MPWGLVTVNTGVTWKQGCLVAPSMVALGAQGPQRCCWHWKGPGAGDSQRTWAGDMEEPVVLLPWGVFKPWLGSW